MFQPAIAVVGNNNITRNNLNNVGNRIQIFYGSKQNGALTLLETKVAFDALLNSEGRYPPPKCHVNTRIAVQGVVTNWICRRGEWADKGIMWISGAPGVGKSAIVQTVCEDLDTDDGSQSWLAKFGFSDRSVDGSHFFGKGLGDREKASFFPATIAYQLGRSRTSCHDVIKKTIKNRPAILSESFTSQFRQLLINTASKQWSFRRPITIVIDALDECDNVDDQVELLKLILEAVTTTNMRFLIASRPEEQIHTFFQQNEVSQHTYHIRLDEESFNTSRDIEVFLRDEFARIRRTRPQYCLPLNWPGNIIITQLRDDSDSQFIFPVLAIAFIDTPFYSPDQQLQTLLEAPPPHAFSKLDALYERILSRGPPELREGSDGLLDYQKLVKRILAAIITWSEPLSAPKIAEVLGNKVDVVQSIILGPMRSLFKFDSSNPNSPIMLCHKSLRDYLLDIMRSHRFFISSQHTDALFVGIISRRPPIDHSYSADEVRRVLAVMALWRGKWALADIAGVLDVNQQLVQSVVHGPTKVLFRANTDGNIELSTSSLEPFLLDGDRSGELSIQDEDLDTPFTQILSRPPPSDIPHPYYSDGLLDVLAILVVQEEKVTKCEIVESLLGIESDLVNHIVHGPAKLIFDVDSEGNISFSTPLMKPFLQDARRSGKFFIQGSCYPDAIFMRILSRQPPSDPSQSYSPEVLMGVLAIVVALERRADVSQIASLLDVAPSLVGAVVFGPTKVLFTTGIFGHVDFSAPDLKDFLRDANRAGEYFVPTTVIDAIFIRILSRQPPSDPSRSYSPEVLMGVLAIVVALESGVEVSQIASFLGVAPRLVEGVVYGQAAKVLFVKDYRERVGLFIPDFKAFLLDANRAGQYFIGRKPDALFTQALSRQPSSGSLRTYSREVMMGVVGVLQAQDKPLSIHHIASALDVSPTAVRAFVFGPVGLLFVVWSDDPNKLSLSTEALAFLRDPNRAGVFFHTTQSPYNRL